MKLALVALISAVAAAGLGFGTTAALASADREGAEVIQHLSAKKKHKRVRVHVEPRYHGGYYAPGWGVGVGADPSLPPPGYGYGLARARASGRCVEDLGYGRYRYCGW